MLGLIEKHAVELSLVGEGPGLTEGGKLNLEQGSASASIRATLSLLQAVTGELATMGSSRGQLVVDSAAAGVLSSAVEALQSNMSALLQRRGKRLSQLEDGGSGKRGSGRRSSSEVQGMGEAFNSFTHIFDQSTQEAVLGYVAAQPRVLSAKERVRKAIRRLGRVALWTRALSLGGKDKAERRAGELTSLMERAASSGASEREAKAAKRAARNTFRGGAPPPTASLWPEG